MQELRYLIFLFVLLCSFVLSSTRLYAQNGSKQVYGFVVDTAGVKLKGVNIRLTSSKDTLITASSASGSFKFDKITGDNLRISFSMLGYQIYFRSYPMADNIPSFMVPEVVLIPQSSLIKEVVIIKKIPVVYKQDTIQYNLDAFNFRKNALLEEGLRQLPGIQVSRDGSVYSNGQLISSVLVDGKKFFGGDVLTATRNLPIEFIKQLQVVDYYGSYAEAKGIKTEDPEKVINIVLKDDRKKISFGQVTSGAGTSDRYLGSVGFNKFNDGREFSVIGSINNTNTSLFTYGSPNGAGERERTLTDVGDFAEPVDGLNTIKSLGFNFAEKISNTTNATGSYSFTARENKTKGNSLLTSRYVGNYITNSEQYEANTNDFLHKLTLEFNTKFKNKDILTVSPVLSFNKIYAGNKRDRYIDNNRVHNEGQYKDTTSTKNANLDINVMYSKYFQKAGRRLVGNFTVNANSAVRLDNVLDTYHILDSTAAMHRIEEFRQSQFIQQNNGANSAKVSLSYVEPFFEHSLLEVRYDYDATQMDAYRIVEDKIKTQDYGSPFYVDSLKVDYKYLYRSNRAGLTYQYEPNKSFRSTFGFVVQPVTLIGRLPNQQENYTYSSVNLVPTAMFKWRFAKDMDWSMDYLGKNNQPSFAHIIPIRDNTNSQNIIVGNPELKAEFSNRISTSIRKSITSRSQYLELNFAYNFISNKIVSDKTVIGNSTVQETTFKNADGYYDLKWYYLFSTPLFTESLQLDIFGNADYYNNLSYINDQRNLTKQVLYSQTLQVKYSWSDYFESVFNTNYMLNNAKYSWPFRSEITAQSFLMSAGTRGYWGKHVTIGAEMSQRFNDGYTNSFMNKNPTIINAFLEFSFLKNNQALLRLQGFDLLDQNENMGIYSEYIGNDAYEAKNFRLGRYYMVSLNLRLQKFNKNK